MNFTKIKNIKSKFTKSFGAIGSIISYFISKYSLAFMVLGSLLLCFFIEWASRHSFSDGIGFVRDHTKAYLYNSFVIFVCLLPTYLFKKRTLYLMLVVAVFVALGLTNCIVLLNRVTPFGFTDISMIGDLLTMQNTNYFTLPQQILVVAITVAYLAISIIVYKKSSRKRSRVPYIFRLAAVLVAFTLIPTTTKALHENGTLDSYFGNLAQGYLDNGALYGFGTSMFYRGMEDPSNYSYDDIKQILSDTDQGESSISGKDGPNVIVVLLESFYDVSEVNFISTSEDPIPYFHELEEEFSTGHLTVPVVGAGTCNSEFEILTGMSCQFFGPGEYPQKTILKKTNCESFANNLNSIGYASHVVHNNGGNFYSRKNAFSQMGFNTFQCKETLDITEYTPLGSWPTDDILVGATVDALDSTEGSDFVYTITVEAHGDYPEKRVVNHPEISVKTLGKDDAEKNKWEYYINQLHSVDSFIKDFTEALDERDEDTLVIMFGDHLPTMGLTEDEVSTGDLFQTKYITWNNFGMEKQDADLTSYQLVAEYLDRIDVHGGTMTNYHQAMIKDGVEADTPEYMYKLQALQYDMLYGERYVYDGKNKYPATNIKMGIRDIEVDKLFFYGDKVHVYGDGFTRWAKVYVNGEKVDTTYESGQRLTISSEGLKMGDVISVCYVGSSDTIFRESNKIKVISVSRSLEGI